MALVGACSGSDADPSVEAPQPSLPVIGEPTDNIFPPPSSSKAALARDLPAAPALGGTRYPILAPSSAHAVERHYSEARHGTVGLVERAAEALTALSPVCDETSCRRRLTWELNGASQNDVAGFFVSLGRLSVQPVDPTGAAGELILLGRDGAFDLTDLCATRSTIASRSKRLGSPSFSTPEST